jgi:WD40 repeat protein
MADHDRVLIDPTREELADALQEAVAAVNFRARSRVLAWPPAGPDPLAEAVGTAEGWRQWVPEGRIRSGETSSLRMLAWWSDRAGRKHHRLVARRGEFNSMFRRNVLSVGEDRPPLWLVYPEHQHLYLRQRGTGWELVAVCACGAVGTPEELGWMGPCCGPCHDRREAGEPAPAGPPTLLTGHVKPVDKVVFSPDGRTLVALAHFEPSPRAWDLATGQADVWAHAEWVRALAFTPDGTRYAAGEWGKVLVCALPNQERLQALAVPRAPVQALAFSPDGQTLAVGAGSSSYGARGTTLLWDTATWKRRPFAGFDRVGRARCLAFAPDGRTLAAALDDDNVTLWEAPGYEVRAVLRGGRPQQMWNVPSLSWSPDGRRLASADAHGDVQVWDAATGQVLASAPGAGGHAVAFAPDGSVLAALGSSGTVRFLDPADGHVLGTFRWHGVSAAALAFSPDGRWLATGGEDRTVKLWPWRQLLDAG